MVLSRLHPLSVISCTWLTPSRNTGETLPREDKSHEGMAGNTPTHYAVNNMSCFFRVCVCVFYRLDINTHVGEFWFLLDASWMSRWVDFVMGKANPPGPISNYNLYDQKNSASAARRACEKALVTRKQPLLSVDRRVGCKRLWELRLSLCDGSRSVASICCVRICWRGEGSTKTIGPYFIAINGVCSLLFTVLRGGGRGRPSRAIDGCFVTVWRSVAGAEVIFFSHPPCYIVQELPSLLMLVF